jgi:hypothetical protein
MAAPPKRIRPMPARALVDGNTLAFSPVQTPVSIKPLPAKVVSTGSQPTSTGNSGSNVLQEPIGHLIQHVKQYDPMLYEALQRVGSQVNSVSNVVNNNLNALPQLFKRTIDIYDTTVGNSIAPMQPVYGSTPGDTQTAILVEAVLTNTIGSDLTLRINNIDSTGTSQVVGLFTIPAATPVGLTLLLNTFMNASMPYNSVLSWDITASDGSTNKYGVATFNLWWQDGG